MKGSNYIRKLGRRQFLEQINNVCIYEYQIIKTRDIINILSGN